MPDRLCRASRQPLSVPAVSTVHRCDPPRATLPARLACVLSALALAWLPASGASAQDGGLELRGMPLVAPAKAWDAPEPWKTDRFYFQFAYYTLHFNPDPEHHQSYTFDMEYRFDRYWLEGQWLTGLSLFQNSFGQFSQYAYGGLQWRPWRDHPQGYVKVTAGLLHGYKGEYRDKIPFNHYEIAPAIIPSVGYCWGRYCGEFVLLGASAALFTVGVTVP